MQIEHLPAPKSLPLFELFTIDTFATHTQLDSNELSNDFNDGSEVDFRRGVSR